MLLYAVAAPPWVHGDSSQDGSERSLNSPENQCSTGFQPVFFEPPRDFLQVFASLPWQTLGYALLATSGRGLRFGNRLVLDREIDRIRNVAKLMGALVERFGLFD
jgi:hypothetical protein